jgi:beta/gamma crystallin
MTIERSAGSCPNPMLSESSGMRIRSAGLRAAGAAVLMTLTAAAALAFITAVQAQQQKKPTPPAARAAPAPPAVVRQPSPPPQRIVTRPPSPPPQQRIVTRPPSPPPQQRIVTRPPSPQQRIVTRPPPPQQRIVTRPPPPQQRIVTRPPPPQQRIAIPNRPLTPTQPPQRPQRTVIPNGPVGTPRPGQNAIPQGPRGREPAQAAGLSPTGLKFGPRGPVATPARLPQGPNALRQARFPAVTVNNRLFPIVRSERFIHMGGRNRFFVPLAALGAVLVGGSYWNPDGYVSVPAPFCTGFTPDGCQLHWREVDFVDGGGEPQCVQYCQLAGPPPAQIATLPPPPPLPAQGTCRLTIFSDANFAGTSAPTGDNQPNLSESGWQDEISSIQVQAGIWDFFTDDDYGGNTMRLTAGAYPMLTPDWDKKINSFMCVAPGPGA